jgi:signal transduction histidine kinase
VAEALTNVVKHAQARRCLIELTRHDTGLVVRVSDDGIGPGLSVPNGRSVGLASIRSRVGELGGTCAVVPGAGTTIEATLPVPA